MRTAVTVAFIPCLLIDNFKDFQTGVLVPTLPQDHSAYANVHRAETEFEYGDEHHIIIYLLPMSADSFHQLAVNMQRLIREVH